jgi:hypothetical protein
MFIARASVDCRTPFGVPCSRWSRRLEFERAGALLCMLAEHRTPKGVPCFYRLRSINIALLRSADRR